jgi:hypothetical protein
MNPADITLVASDNAVTRRERRRQSTYREQVLRLPAGTDRQGRELGLADAAVAVPELASWATEFRRRYVGVLEEGRG